MKTLLISTGFLALLFVSIGCEQTDLTVQAVEIDFLNVRTIEEGDWIEIDGVRFNHVRAFEDVDVESLTLPASRITRGESRRNSEFTEPFPSLNIGYLLASYLHNMNKEEELMVDHDYTYKIVDPDLVMALGKLRLLRSDSSDIQIRTSENYPVSVTTISLD